jgi:hypothetical protein
LPIIAGTPRHDSDFDLSTCTSMYIIASSGLQVKLNWYDASYQPI